MTDEPTLDPAALRLDHFLKLCGAAETGGQAKQFIQAGEVLVNGEQETRRRKKLAPTDIVQFEGGSYLVSEVLADL